MSDGTGIAGRDGLQRVTAFEEGVDDVGVEVAAALLDDEAGDFDERQRVLVDATADQGVEHIGQRHQARRQRDRFTLDTLRVATAVPALVMQRRDLARHDQEIERPALRSRVGAGGARGASEVFVGREFAQRAVDRLAADFGVPLHDLELLAAQAAGLQQDRVRNADLADIVQRRGLDDGLEAGRRQLIAIFRMLRELTAEDLDEELRAAMAGRGLGTPATRAQIIENLIAEHYLAREGRELIPTAKAFQLMTALKGLAIEELTSPELTGEWEHKLARMERGELSRAEFMKDIAAMAAHIVAQAKNHESDTVPGDFATLTTPCPKCGGVIKENYKKFQCQRCEFSLWKIVAGRQFETAEIETLLAQRQVGPLQGFRSRMGRAFAAIIRLNDQLEPEFDFGQARAEAEGTEPVDFTGQEPLGPCPKCGARVFEHGLSYVCERAVGPARACDFRSGTIILQQAISRAEMQKLLDTGRTSLLRGFVSSRTRRKFSAFLVRGADGKVGFEFEARAPKASKAGPDDTTSADAKSRKPAASGVDKPKPRKRA